MSRKPARKSHAGAWLASAGATGVFLAAIGGHGHHHGVTESPGSLHTTAVSAGSATASANAALGQRLAARDYGWRRRQWRCLDDLWTGESDWDQYNTYPSHDTPPSTPAADITTAYGIPQALPAQKMATAGADWQTDPATQIRWGLGYIAATYTTPCGALAFKQAHGNQGY